MVAAFVGLYSLLPPGCPLASPVVVLTSFPSPLCPDSGPWQNTKRAHRLPSLGPALPSGLGEPGPPAARVCCTSDMSGSHAGSAAQVPYFEFSPVLVYLGAQSVVWGAAGRSYQLS